MRVNKLLAFDIETAKVLPDSVKDILDYRPLGITCAVAIASDLPNPFVWHGTTADGQPASQLSKTEAENVVTQLEDFVAKGYTIVTWNGLGFDLPVLSDESGSIERCARLATGHVDMLFHALCALVHFISLHKAAEGMQLQGKLAGHSGATAPALWVAGRHSEVIAYCIQDVRVTLALAEAAQAQRRLSWITNRGTLGKLSLPNGWLPVSQAKLLPLPDTSWMSEPPTRERFLQWLMP